MGSKPFFMTLGGRALVLLGLAVAVAPSAWADDTVSGTWEGHYSCGQGDTALTLILRPGPTSGELDGLFHFQESPDNAGVPEGCFAMSGNFDRQSREVKLSAGRWLLQPFGYVTVDLVGRLGSAGRRLSGHVVGPLCQGFDLQRVSGSPAPIPSACLNSGTVASIGPDQRP